MEKLLIRFSKILINLLNVLPRKKVVDTIDKIILAEPTGRKDNAETGNKDISTKTEVAATIKEDLGIAIEADTDIEQNLGSGVELHRQTKSSLEAGADSAVKEEETNEKATNDQSKNQDGANKIIYESIITQKTSLLKEYNQENNYEVEVPRWVKVEGANKKPSEEGFTSLAQTPLESLGCSIRTTNALYRAGIKRVEDIQGMSSEDLLSIKNFGKKGLEELYPALENAGYVVMKNIWWKKNESLDTQTEVRSHNTQDLEKENKIEIYGTRKAKRKISQKDNEEIKDELSEFIEQSIKNPDAETIQKIMEVIYELTNKLADGESKTEIMKGIMDASDFYQYPSIYGEEEKFRLKASTLILIERVFKREDLQSTDIDFAKNVRKYCSTEQNSALHLFQRAMAGEALQRIGDSLKIPITKESVRQKIDKIGKLFLIKPKETQDIIKEALEHEITNRMAKFYSKEILDLSDLKYESIKKLMYTANLRERLEIIQERLKSVPIAEYDYHYEIITNQAGNNVGAGYWNDIERLKQYLYRHASSQGTPELMPKQITLPNSVRGAVTRFGGQNHVANKIGLEYQGQLVAEGQGGRTYWDHEKVQTLFQKINDYIGTPNKSSVSQKDIKNYFEYSGDIDLIDKKVYSFLAAIERLDIPLDNETSSELWTLKIKAETNDLIAPETLLKEHKYISKSESLFTFDAKAASKMRDEDQELKNELDSIFADKTDEKDPVEEKNSDSHNESNAIFDIKDILSLIRQEHHEDLVELSIIRNYAAGKKLMPASLIDRINEFSIKSSGEILLEAEDEKTLYVNKTALDKLI